MSRARVRRLFRRLRAGLLGRALVGTAAIGLLTGSSAFGQGLQAQPNTQVVHLQRGWNNVAYYGGIAEPTTALASIKGHYSAVYQFDPAAQRYLAHDPSNPSAGDLKQMQPGRAYWIVATSEVDLTLAAASAGIAPALTRGWNNFVYTGPALPPAQALASLSGHFALVYGWDASTQRFRVYAPAPDPGDLSVLTPFACYWIEFN